MLLGYIAKIIYIVVFVVVLELLVPAKQYKKYFDMCAGFIVIIAMLHPLVEFLGLKGSVNNVVNFSDNIFLDRRDLVAKKEILGKGSTLIAIYKRELGDKILCMLKEIDINARDINIHINEDNKSDNFGEIKKLCVVVHPNCNMTAKEVALILSRNLNVDKERITVVLEN